jgi:hypothetical protein
MSFTNAATLAKDAFLIKVKEQLDINKNTDNNLSYEGLKTRVKTCNRVAKIIIKDMRNNIDELIRTNATGKIENFMSVIYLKMTEMIDEASNAHRRSYITSDKEITKIKKYAIKLQKNARKALDIVYDLMQNLDMSLIPKYDLIVAKHNNIQSGYWLRTRKPVNYVEEDANCDDPSDEDYKPYEHVSKTIVINSNSRPKRNIPVVDYTGMDTDTIDYDSDYNPNDEEDEEDDDEDYECQDTDDDNDSEYNPSDDEELEDDHVLEFCDDDYAEETEEDDDDYEDDDESNQEDNEFLSDYYNDPDYTSNKNTVDVDYDDDSEYIPDENDELDDDHLLEFDDDDYAEESEEDDDDYEDDSEDEEDKQFVSDYHNDPDYEYESEDDDELEYDYSFKNKKVDENGNIILKGGIVDDEDEEYIPEDDEDDEDDEDEEYIPEDDEDDEDEDEYVIYSYKKDNLITVCKRMYNRNTGKGRFNWIKMSENDYAKKYDQDYVCEDN